MPDNLTQDELDQELLLQQWEKLNRKNSTVIHAPSQVAEPDSDSNRQPATKGKTPRSTVVWSIFIALLFVLCILSNIPQVKNFLATKNLGWLSDGLVISAIAGVLYNGAKLARDSKQGKGFDWWTWPLEGGLLIFIPIVMINGNYSKNLREKEKDRTDSLKSQFVQDNLNSLLDSSRSVLKNLHEVAQDMQSNLLNSEAIRYPLFPMDIKIEYKVRFKRGELFYDSSRNFSMPENSLPLNFELNDTMTRRFGTLFILRFQISKTHFKETGTLPDPASDNAGFSPQYLPVSTILYTTTSRDITDVHITRMYHDVPFDRLFISDIVGGRDLVGRYFRVTTEQQRGIPSIVTVVLSGGAPNKIPRYKIDPPFETTTAYGGRTFFQTIITTKSLVNRKDTKKREPY